jgi:predicted nucleic acid-binding protein
MSNSWLCVDANLVIRLVADPTNDAIQALWEDWVTKDRRVAAPTLLLYEVTNAVYRYQKLGYLSSTAAQFALEAALALPIELDGDPDLHWRALELAQTLELPAAYDAHYLALAERLGAEFWTADRHLARRVQDSLPWVHPVETK